MPSSVSSTSLDSAVKSSDSFIPAAIPQVGRVHGSAEFWFFATRTTANISAMLKSLEQIANAKPKTVAKITLLTYELQHLQKLLQTLSLQADNREEFDTSEFGCVSVSMKSSMGSIADSVRTDKTQRDGEDDVQLDL
uniref:EKC/KEOPS complex subunit GON7 n=1 Tax=Panagrellus redivivus TaxID=6233 RepID=A0A7E4V8A9_PANRE